MSLKIVVLMLVAGIAMAKVGKYLLEKIEFHCTCKTCMQVNCYRSACKQVVTRLLSSP